MVALAEFYAGCQKQYKHCGRLGLQLAIVSQKRRDYIQGILARGDLLDAFDVIVGGGDAAYKPNPEGLLLAVAQTDSIPQNCFYVGDSVTDAKTAQRAAVPFIAVLCGVTPRTAFDDYDVYAILEDVSEVLNLGPVKNVTMLTTVHLAKERVTR